MAYMSDEWKGNEYFKINDFDYVEFLMKRRRK